VNHAKSCAATDFFNSLLVVDGEPAAEAKLDETVGLLWGEDASVGWDSGTALTDKYQRPFSLGGEIKHVDIDTSRGARDN
jgi:hypothetical protein